MLQATLEVLSEALLHPHKLKFAGSPIGSEARDSETKTSPSGHPACGLERCQLDTCNTKKKRQSRVRIQFLAAGARLFLSRKGPIISYLIAFERLFRTKQTKKEPACSVVEQAGVPIDQVIGGLRVRKGLFYLLTLESIGFVSSEDEDLAVTEELAGWHI